MTSTCHWISTKSNSSNRITSSIKNCISSSSDYYSKYSSSIIDWLGINKVFGRMNNSCGKCRTST
jgi:hypothetical protein